MLTNQRLKTILEEAKEISGIDFLIFDIKGNQIAETIKLDYIGLGEKVTRFIDSQDESLIIKEFNFIKVSVKENPEYILVFSSLSEEGFTVGRLVSAQIKNISEVYYRLLSKSEFLSSIINGNIQPSEINDKAKNLRLELHKKRKLFLIETSEHTINTVKETLSNLINVSRDYIFESNGKFLVLVKSFSENEKPDIGEYASSIIDTLQAEAMTRVRLGISNTFYNLTDLAVGYKEAGIALKVGRIFYEDRDIFVYDKLGIGRLINQLPLELCEMFVEEVLGEKVSGVFDEENSNIIHAFFKNNLNISETARQLFMHRNTLVYRLERIERNTGLDVRKFDDAILYTIVKMVLKHIKNTKNE